MRRGFVPVNTGRDDAIGPVLVGQPLQGLLEERLFLFWRRCSEPFRAGRHHVFNGQHRVFAPFLRQQSPQLAHRLVRVFGDQVLIVGCALRVSIARLAFPVTMLHRGRHRAHVDELLRSHNCVCHVIPNPLEISLAPLGHLITSVLTRLCFAKIVRKSQVSTNFSHQPNGQKYQRPARLRLAPPTDAPPQRGLSVRHVAGGQGKSAPDHQP